MGTRTRHKTTYPGVIFFEHPKGKVYYALYRKTGEKRVIEEKVGNSWQGMTPAKANLERSQRMNGKTLSNKETRQAKREAEQAKRNRMTISKLWELYEEKHSDMPSFISDKSRYTSILEPVFGNKMPPEIIALDLDRLVRVTMKGKAAQTIRHALGLLSRIAKMGGGLQVAIKGPRVDNIVTESLNKEELKNLIKALDESDDVQISTLMRLVLFTGMRRGELLKLQWSDVDFDNDFIFLRSPKGKKSVHIPMNAQARAILEKHPKIGTHVFVGKTGEPFVNIHKRVNVIRKAAKLPRGFRPLHGLRHTFASMLASSGQVDMYVLQKLLTHKSPEMTQRYAHLHDEALKKASGVVVDLIEENGK